MVVLAFPCLFVTIDQVVPGPAVLLFTISVLLFKFGRYRQRYCTVLYNTTLPA
jgi:hypothetical protein